VIRTSWLRAEPAQESFGPDDLTIHLRAGDLWQAGCDTPVHPEYHALPLSFYADVVNERPWRKVVVVTEDDADPMVRALVSRFGAVLLSGTPLEDFARLRASSNLILSVSSFSWWAAWLSAAQRIYFPVAGLFDGARAARRPVAWQQDLWVNDEPRYLARRPRHSLMSEDWRGTEANRRALLTG
jgi:hypothetical protein